MKIVLSGTPKSTNHLYKSHCRFGHPTVYMTADGKTLKESYQWQAKSQWGGKPTKKAVEVFIELYFDSNRKHDIDNYGKILLDSLTGIVWNDDNQIWKMMVCKMIDKNNPRIEIDIVESL
jgi:crossover junction endodeoxyribonuclease RusA